MSSDKKIMSQQAENNLAAALKDPVISKALTDYADWVRLHEAENLPGIIVEVAIAQITGRCSDEQYRNALEEIANHFGFSVADMNIIADSQLEYIEETLSGVGQSPIDFDWRKI